MSLSLGEKLRQAREERGISISEVADQTRISPLYIKSIENDDYKPLPGGIFNKGFVKSYAKFIGLDEQEALQDYSRIVAQTEVQAEEIQRNYRPEVLTDDRSIGSMLPTIIFAGIILALMTGGILFVVNYIQNRPETVNSTNTATNTAGNTNANSPGNAVANLPSSVPTMAALRVVFQTAGNPISLSSVSDGKNLITLVETGKPATFEPRESLRLSYAKSLAAAARLSINDKPIQLPQTPANPKRIPIEIEINKDNLATIWQSGAISFGTATGPTPAAETSPAGTPAGTGSPVSASPTPASRPTPRPTAAESPSGSPARATPTPIVVGNRQRVTPSPARSPE